MKTEVSAVFGQVLSSGKGRGCSGTLGVVPSDEASAAGVFSGDRRGGVSGDSRKSCDPQRLSCSYPRRQGACGHSLPRVPRRWRRSPPPALSCHGFSLWPLFTIPGVPFAPLPESGKVPSLAGLSQLPNLEVCLIAIWRLWGSYLLAQKGELCLALFCLYPGSCRGARLRAITDRDSLGNPIFRCRYETYSKRASLH